LRSKPNKVYLNANRIKSVQEAQFKGYQKAKGGGWVSAEVKFFVDGKLATMEE